MDNKPIITPREISMAIASMPTLLSMLRADPDPTTAFRAARLLALLPPEDWDQINSELLAIVGSQLDIAALEQVVAENKRSLGL